RNALEYYIVISWRQGQSIATLKICLRESVATFRNNGDSEYGFASFGIDDDAPNRSGRLRKGRR
ncbi:MAG: hypothetical protein RIF32_10265, partial [Leptospirales bacterium]